MLISTSAISIDKISNAVPESNPLLKTVLEILSGFSRTCVWCSLEPIVETIPSPTRAIIVSSPAPPTKRAMLARTVIRAFALTSIPFIATPAINGVSMTLGLTDICTASNTSRPAKSIAAPRSNGKLISALCAAILASTTRSTLPPAK